MSAPWLPAIAVLASVLAAALRDRPRWNYWLASLGSALVCSVAFGVAVRDPGPPGNSPIALAVAFVSFPTMLTFLVERAALRGRRDATAALVALPLGLATFAAAVFIAATVSVNAGILSP